jgi:hypothetical protein
MNGRQKRPFPERRFLTKAVNKVRAVRLCFWRLKLRTISIDDVPDEEAVRESAETTALPLASRRGFTTLQLVIAAGRNLPLENPKDFRSGVDAAHLLGV